MQKKTEECFPKVEQGKFLNLAIKTCFEMFFPRSADASRASSVGIATDYRPESPWVESRY